MKKFFIVILPFINFCIYAQYTAIPDVCFESILVNSGVDTEGVIDGQVLTADIINVTSLDLGGFSCDVHDATGIANFTNLEYLFIGHSITSIDLSNNIHLKIVSAYQGNLQSINLSNCTELYYLEIIENHITNIDLSDNINLELLNLVFNNIASIDLTNNTKIKTLSLGYNQLTNLDINSLIYLETLGCQGNQISNIEIQNLENLKILYLNFNQINTINLNNLPLLEGLGVAENNITDLDLSNFINLKSLNCRDNNLTHLNVRNNNNQNFTYFNATNNPNLTCIFVDDANYSTTNWTNIDSNSIFVETEADCDALAVNETILNDDVFIYPNPTKDFLFINNLDLTKIEDIKIFNLLGKLVINKKNAFDKINLSSLKPAIYLIRIKTKNKTIYKKIIKK